MNKVAVLIASTLLLCACAVGQSGVSQPGANVMYFQQPVPGPEPGDGPPPPNVFFHTQKMGDGKVSAGYFAIADFGNPVTGAPYSATAATESTQVLADGNRIVNKTTALLARDSQGRTRREETMGNIGPLAMNGPKMAFITDPVSKVSYILDLNNQTAQVMKAPDIAVGGPGTAVAIGGKQVQGNVATMSIQKKIIISGSTPGMEQRIWVDFGNDGGQAKSESLGTQVIEGVAAEGTRVTRTIPAGQIGNERALEITSEVWTSPELQMVILSKRNDPRFGETIYRLTDIRRAEPDPSLFQVPSSFSIKSAGN
jgi:hypothetical protein